MHDAALEYLNGGDEHSIVHDHLVDVRGGLPDGEVERIIRVDARGALG